MLTGPGVLRGGSETGVIVQFVLQIKVEAYPGEAKKKPAAQGKKKGAAAASKK